METQSYNQDKLEFRQIVLKHIQTILEISSHELRDNSMTITKTNHSEIIYKEDTRKSYIQAIENLAFILLPYFDDKIKELYKTRHNVIGSYRYQLEKMFEEEVKEALKEMKIEVMPDDWFVNKKVFNAKELFIGLNLLLNRNDYLKSAVYGEDKDELVSDEEESEGDVE